MSAILPECSLVVAYAQSREPHEPVARSPGRPKTRTDAHYVALLKEHARMADWFSAAFGRPAKSDIELLTSFFSADFRSRGMRESRATSPDMLGKLKTLRNELSNARRLNRCPENSLLTGRYPVDS